MRRESLPRAGLSFFAAGGAVQTDWERPYHREHKSCVIEFRCKHLLPTFSEHLTYEDRCLPPKQWDGADLEKLNNGSKHTQTELAYEINRIWLDNSAHIPLSLVPQALSTNQLRYNPKSLHRQGVWPADFNDYIMMFKGDELALYKSITPTPQRWASKGPPQLLANNQWSWYPSHPLDPVQATSLSDFMETTMQPAEQYVDSGRSAFKDYSGMPRASIVDQRVYTNPTTAWIITRNYETEASTSNEDERELAHTYQPSSVRMHLQEYDPSDRYPYLSWVQRLLRAAREAGTEEIWLDCVEARRLGLSYEACKCALFCVCALLTVCSAPALDGGAAGMHCHARRDF